MKDETLANIRKDYDDRRLSIKEYNTVNSELFKLQKNPDVARYLKLRGIGLIYPNNESIQKSVNEIFLKYLSDIDEKDTNDIYLYIGIWDRGSEEYEDSYVFWNLEQKNETVIPLGEYEEFIEKHNVIFSDSEDRGHLYMIEDELPAVRAKFIHKAIETDQERAKEYILTMHK